MTLSMRSHGISRSPSGSGHHNPRGVTAMIRSSSVSAQDTTRSRLSSAASKSAGGLSRRLNILITDLRPSAPSVAADGTFPQVAAVALQRDQLAEQAGVIVRLLLRVDPLQLGLHGGHLPTGDDFVHAGEHPARVALLRLVTRRQRLDGQ